jgi:A/G-specific adenine glycosylase
MLNINEIIAFKNLIWNFYLVHRRTFPWRHNPDPYAVVISEIMLQQTQTYRVEPKYTAFLAALPTLDALANADLRTVLSLWQGLGYNRRGKFLHAMAREIMQNHNGIIPDTPELLVQLPGIGKATAGSICAFAFNKPTLFIETNIRTVFIHYFFPGQQEISDNQLLPFLSASLEKENPREWYYALMDYGVHLKKTVPNPSRKSKHHTMQSRFEGSDRQIRGVIIRTLTNCAAIKKEELINSISKDTTRVERILKQLIKEQLVVASESDVFIM